jgi:TolB protein
LITLIITILIAVTPGSATSPSWIAFASTRDGNREIYRVSIDGSGLRNSPPGFHGINRAQWSPDGEWIVFDGRQDTWSIYRMRADGSDLQNLTAHLGDSLTPQWSPDGAWILFVRWGEDRARDIWRMRADGRDIQRLTGNLGTEPSPQWSPDGDWIVYVSGYDTDSDIYRMRADGSDEQILTTANGNDPQWSPDGEWIMFVVENVITYNDQIYRVRADGSEQQLLTPDAPGCYPQWSPDGEWIVYVSGCEPAYHLFFKPRDIYRMGADGSEKIRLSDLGGLVSAPQWSPDGEWIVFTLFDVDKHQQLYRMRADGTDQQNLTPDLDWTVQPQWSPDGEWIMFLSIESSGYAIYRMRADGSDKQRLTNGLFASPPLTRSWHPWRIRVAGVGLVLIGIALWCAIKKSPPDGSDSVTQVD